MARYPQRLPGREIERFEDKVILSNSTDKQGELIIYGGASGEKALDFYNGSTELLAVDATSTTKATLKSPVNLYVLGSASGADILLQPNNDTDDYFKFSTLSNVPTIFGAGAYLRIGDAAFTSHSLASEDDLMVSGKLEVDGGVYMDGYVQIHAISGETILSLKSGGGGGTSYGDFLGYSNDGIHFGLRGDNNLGNNNFIITSYVNNSKDHDHATASANPTIIIHSNTNPDTDNSQWISFAHNQTNGVITTGKGDLNLAPATDVVSFGTWTTSGDVAVNGYVTIKDSGGTTRKLATIA